MKIFSNGEWDKEQLFIFPWESFIINSIVPGKNFDWSRNMWDESI